MKKPRSQVGKDNFRLIETELKNYRRSKLDLREIEETIIYGSTTGSEIRGTDISKPTEQKAIKMYSSAYIRELNRRIEAIEYGVNTFKASGNQKKVQFLELKYFDDRYNDFGVMMKLDINNGMFYRWRKEIVELIAIRLGWRLD